MMGYLDKYTMWAQTLDDEQRFWIWASCLVFLLAYIIVDNWNAEWMKDPPEDPPSLA